MSSLFKKKPLAALCVELFDVVVTCPLTSYRELAAEAYGCAPEQIEDAVSRHWADLEMGKLKPDQFWDEVGAELTEMGVQHSVPGWKFKGIWDSIVADNLTLDKEMMKTIQQAKDLKIRTVASANLIPEVVVAFQKAGVFEPFKNTALSCQITARKPSPRVFAQMAKLARLPAKQCLYVDRDPTNLAAAKAAGFQVLAHEGKAADTRWELLQLGLIR